MSLATTYACALLCRQGAWAARRGDGRTAATAARMVDRNLVVAPGPEQLALGMDEDIPVEADRLR